MGPYRTPGEQPAVSSGPARIPIRYACDCTESGYGYAARGNLRALELLGWDRYHVRVVPAVFWKQDAGEAPDRDWLTETYLDAYERRPEPDRGINIVHAHPCHLGMFWSAGWYNIACTAWETLSLPQGTYPVAAGTRTDRTVLDTINDCYDEVWVPAEHVKKVFEGSGVKKPIFVVPHALLPELLEREPRTDSPVIPKIHPAASGEKGGEACRFYSIGSWDLRKDPMALLRAYWTVGWKIYDPVELLLHTQGGGKDQQQEIQALRGAMPDWSDLPSMSPCSGRRSYSWVLDVHRGGHVFVTSSHGEAFCLPAVEALAMGNLVVGAKGPLAHLQWAMDEGFVVGIDCHEADIAIMPEHAGYELGQKWWDMELAALSTGLREALQRAQEGLLPLAEGAEETRRRYSVERTAEAIRPRLEEAQRVLKAKEW